VENDVICVSTILALFLEVVACFGAGTTHFLLYIVFSNLLCLYIYRGMALVGEDHRTWGLAIAC
jgi:hypothetical protein